MLDNISLKGKERKGERGHSILLRARDSRARKGKKKGKWNYAALGFKIRIGLGGQEEEDIAKTPQYNPSNTDYKYKFNSLLTTPVKSVPKNNIKITNINLIALLLYFFHKELQITRFPSGDTACTVISATPFPCKLFKVNSGQ